MFDTLVSSIENTFVQFSFRRLLYIIFLLAVVLGGAFVLDRETGYSVQRRLNGQVSALERLYALEQKGIATSPTLAQAYENAVNELRSEEAGQVWHFNSDPVVKFLAASLLPLLFVGYGLLQMARGDREARSMFGGAFVASLMFGVPALYVPTWRSIRVTAAVLFIAQCIGMWLLVRYFSARRQASAGTGAAAT